MANVSAQTQLDQIIGRYGAPELLGTINPTMAAPASTLLPFRINLSRPLESFMLRFRFRLVIANRNYTAFAETPQNLIQNIRIFGTHRRLNNLTPIDMTGATAWIWPRLFQQRGGGRFVAYTDLGDPATPFIAPAAASWGNIGTYDTEIIYHIPVYPMLPPSSAKAKRIVPYLWTPDDWSDSLQMEIKTGDFSSCGTVVLTGDVTWTAYGSAAGTPAIDIYANYALMGKLARSFPTAVCIRNEATQTAGTWATVASSQLLKQLAHQRTTSIVVKTGVMATAQTAGVQTFNSLNDDRLDRTQIVVDNTKQIRPTASNQVLKDYVNRFSASRLPGGYLVIPFTESMHPATMLRGDQIPGGAVFNLNSDILTANANNAVTVIQEQIFPSPVA